MKNKDLKIAVVGIGTTGCVMVDMLVDSNISDKVKLIAISQKDIDLEECRVPHKVKIKHNVEGLICRSYPHNGKKAALNSYDEIKELLSEF